MATSQIYGISHAAKEAVRQFAAKHGGRSFDGAPTVIRLAFPVSGRSEMVYEVRITKLGTRRREDAR